VEAGDLDRAFKAEIGDGGVGHAEEVVVVQEVVEDPRVDQQGGLDLLGASGGQGLELGEQVRQQILGGLRRADGKADAPLGVRGPGERAEVEADDRLFEPLAGRGDDRSGVWAHAFHTNQYTRAWRVIFFVRFPCQNASTRFPHPTTGSLAGPFFV
jgi:hypothetical protein